MSQPLPANPPTAPRSAWLLLTALAAIKLAVFLALVWAGRVQPFVGDNAVEHYLPIADRLLTEGRFNGPDSRSDSKVPPAYPTLLALAKVVGGRHQVLLVCCLQMLADLLVAATLYWFGRRLGSPNAGLLAGLAWLVYPPAVLLSTWITAETVFTAGLLLALALLGATLERRGLVLPLLAGVTFGLATLLRGTPIVLPVFLLPLWLRRDVPQGLAKGACCLLGMLLVVLPWSIRNRVVLDDNIPVAVGFGSVFLQGSDESCLTIAGKRQNYPMMFARAADSGTVKPATDHESAIDNYLLRVGVHNYRVRLDERPWSLAPFAGWKLARLWYGTESGGRLQQSALAVCSLALLPLGLWQMWRLRRRQPQLTTLTALVLTYFVLLHWVGLPEYRYMHPVMPLLLVYAAAAVVQAIQAPLPQPAAESALQNTRPLP